MAMHEIVHRARLVRDLGEVAPVLANQARLGQVFLNLIVNAAQAVPEGDARGQTIRIVTRMNEAGNVVVEVSDTGRGIPPDVLPRIFDPFFTSKAPGKGTGLGLSVSHGTVKELGGEIRVTSVPEQGTTFQVILPAAKGWRAQDPRAPLAGAARPVEKRRVLVVDDDVLVGSGLARALSDIADMTVLTDAQACVARLAGGERWDVILCDLMMPEMSGMDLYREALAVAPDAVTRMIFMTAGAFTPRARAFLDGVSNRCLEKPFDMAKLRSLVMHAGRS
jgi:CheY-like chemotaxis protein